MRFQHRWIASVAVVSAGGLVACSDTDSLGTSEPPGIEDAASSPPPTEPKSTAGATTAASAPEPTTAESDELPTATTLDDGSEVIDGMFDVGGHELYLHCEGSGSPTVVYLHGAISDPGSQPVANARKIQDAISDTNRFCAYDRRNVGRSETVDAVQTPEVLLSDLRGLLAAAAIEPPYVLLGASFGGMPAYLYANAHPEEVVGMVLLDSMFPDEFSLEHLWPPDERYEASDAFDENDSLERISHYDMHVAAQAFVGNEPDIPVIYLASEQEPWNEQGIPEYDAQVLGLQAGFVERFAPGELIWVDSPHFMEPAIPTEIADALRTVIDRAAT